MRKSYFSYFQKKVIFFLRSKEKIRKLCQKIYSGMESSRWKNCGEEKYFAAVNLPFKSKAIFFSKIIRARNLYSWRVPPLLTLILYQVVSPLKLHQILYKNIFPIYKCLDNLLLLCGLILRSHLIATILFGILFFYAKLHELNKCFLASRKVSLIFHFFLGCQYRSIFFVVQK